VPLLIQCSACGNRGTVPDDYAGKEIRCPRCQKLLVPLTPDKMETYAAKILFSARARGEEIIREAVTGPEIPFACPFCGEAYQVSADLAGKQITCRNCRQACNVPAPEPKKKTRRKNANVSWGLVAFCVFLSLVSIVLGLLLSRLGF
jgi:DNA-directed RNA polymerase subunit RPC12/RpoP